MHTARQTIGYDKKSDGISLSQFVKATNISRDKVIRTIKMLNKKRLLKVTKQTASSGGKSYNRYSLTLVVQKDHLVADKDYPSTSQRLGLVADKDIQHKLIQHKLDKRLESESNDVLISEEQKQKFISFTMAQADIKSPQGYELSMRRKLLKNDPATMEIFFNWQKSYLKAKAFDDFCSMYVGKRLEMKVKDEVLSGKIRDIYKDGGSFIVSIIDGDEYKSIRYSDYMNIKKYIEDEVVAC